MRKNGGFWLVEDGLWVEWAKALAFRWEVDLREGHHRGRHGWQARRHHHRRRFVGARPGSSSFLVLRCPVYLLCPRDGIA